MISCKIHQKILFSPQIPGKHKKAQRTRKRTGVTLYFPHGMLKIQVTAFIHAGIKMQLFQIRMFFYQVGMILFSLLIFGTVDLTSKTVYYP